ncbi:bifunctional metallophosphatase/5'-nucleotidase [Gloeocapsa sp. PCC 73106]|uniref:bifunctional metallophosphatase/5'-nucleotidase n=1 Tax=Gloeocapsa sp. PCC 73106 TaxID=102232 RepID=UPI0002ABDBAD|nr:bifunctional metallophosphatase/5'-nucleotidase [Gloeocapsa sp. PCC 73106]ELR97074.1 5'-nucleotidase/2',3'-cyclic phosphodiesterase-like hydrolase [Gloeocapsa sp. PCC 73106]
MAFTLQILHTSDQEAGIPATQDIIGFSAVMNALEDNYPNTVKLTSGDTYQTGPFFNASNDLYDSETTGEAAGAGGIADILVHNALGWDVASVGNHEFSGIRDVGFFSLLAPNPDLVNGANGGMGIGEEGYPGTNFPYLATNLDYSEANLPPGLNVVPGGQSPTGNSLSTSVVLDVNGEKVGVVGAVTPFLPSIADIGNINMTTGDNITSTTPIAEQVEVLVESIQPEVEMLVAQDINKIILMTHLQLAEIEQALAQALVEENIPVDVLIGGGSHRVMANEDTPLRADETQTPPTILQPYPQEFSEGENSIYYINSGANYRYVAQFVPTFDENGVIISFDEAESQPYATDLNGVANLYPGEIETFEDVRVKADPEIVAIADGVRNFINTLDGNIFGQTDVFLNGLRESIRSEETNYGNLIAESQRSYAQKYLDEYGTEILEGFEEIQISFVNGGGVRDAIGESYIEGGTNALIQRPPQANPSVGKEEGDISALDITNSLRFNDGLIVGTVTAEGLYEIAEHTVSGSFAQISGFKFSFDPTAPGRTETQPGERIQNLVLTNEAGEGILTIVENGELVVDPDLTISVATRNFLANGGGGSPQVIENRVDLSDFQEPNSLADLASGRQQDALAEQLATNYNNDNEQAPFAEVDTPVSQDERIQNLAFRDDTILGDSPTLPIEGPTTVFGTSGNDVFESEVPTNQGFIGANQILFTGSGNDSVDITFAPGGDNSRLDLGSGNDLLFAGSDHRILAGSGDDILFLGSGGGNNIVTGGSDSDQFWLVTDILDLPAVVNTITDFTLGEDVIGFANTDLGFGDLILTQQGSNTVLNALGQDLAIVADVSVADLSEANFVFA